MKAQKGNVNIGGLIVLVVVVGIIALCWATIPSLPSSNVITTTQINNGTTTTLIYPKSSATTTTIIINNGITTTEYIHH